jgi:hypothetical protein
MAFAFCPLALIKAQRPAFVLGRQPGKETLPYDGRAEVLGSFPAVCEVEPAPLDSRCMEVRKQLCSKQRPVARFSLQPSING